MLLDCRGMAAQHNGTSHSILGFLDGFRALHSHWVIDVLVSCAVASFFGLEQRYPELDIVYEQPDDRYAVAILLNQPFGIARVSELHRHALIVLFNMLDTISWDIMYVCDEALDAVWRFVARYADGLFYISEYSRQRFRTRFAPHKSVAECVSYLSVAQEDQVDRSVKPDGGKHILVFGNDYDHKDMKRTIQLLSDAFPYSQIIAIGIEHNGSRNITGLPSGHIEHAVLHRLIADAQVIILPSFYEGFGLPVVQGLAYGRPVLVRRSVLWHELASVTRLPGQLVAYEDTISLVEAVGRILNDLPLDAMQQGTALRHNESPLTWQDCAQRVLTFAEGLLVSADGQRWLEREEALRSIQLLQV
jgi:glycosyltransferase involved in cell wall biosynthesis